LELNPDGSCKHCGVKVRGGDFDWFVTGVLLVERKAQGPLLTENVPEQGTDFPTIYQPNFDAVARRFLAANPGFTWEQFEGRVRYIFLELQQAWATLQWERSRPYTSDNTFQMLLFWITEYQRQHVRNVLKDVTVEQVTPVKITLDAFYDAVTVRVFAHMIDYKADESGRVVVGNRNEVRRFSEYWTFIRRSGVKPNERANNQCPNCGAPLKINMAGVCEYCRGKVTSGDFDWVLSRIEQDEAYRG
jgi:hypothetical protein